MKRHLASSTLYTLIVVWAVLAAGCVAWWFFWHKVVVAFGGRELVARHMRERTL